MSALEVFDLKKSFPLPAGGSHLVLRIPRFQLREAAQVGLRGESGSGKTTFLNLIAGILKPDSGTIRVAGAEMSGLPEAARDRLRARTIGYVFQSFNLLQGYSCLENVLVGMSFGIGADRRRAEALLERVGLADRMHHLPRQLSTGQQQRVAVARALANAPKLVLADEPTGNLDPANARSVITLIREVSQENGAALLFVSHDPNALSHFETVEEFSKLNSAPSSKQPAL